MALPALRRNPDTGWAEVGVDGIEFSESGVVKMSPHTLLKTYQCTVWA